MLISSSCKAVVALAAALLLAACGPGGTTTSTPSSTLGTDSAATRVGGLPDSLQTAAPAGGQGAIR